MMRLTVSKPISGRVHDPVRIRDRGWGWVQEEGKDTPYLGEDLKRLCQMMRRRPNVVQGE